MQVCGRRSQSGFTLVELIAVVLIVGLISMVTVTKMDCLIIPVCLQISIYRPVATERISLSKNRLGPKASRRMPPTNWIMPE